MRKGENNLTTSINTIDIELLYVKLTVTKKTFSKEA